MKLSMKATGDIELELLFGETWHPHIPPGYAFPLPHNCLGWRARAANPRHPLAGVLDSELVGTIEWGPDGDLDRIHSIYDALTDWTAYSFTAADRLYAHGDKVHLTPAAIARVGLDGVASQVIGTVEYVRLGTGRINVRLPDCFGLGPWYVDFDEIEHVPPEPPAFKTGDKVTLTTEALIGHTRHLAGLVGTVEAPAALRYAVTFPLDDGNPLRSLFGRLATIGFPADQLELLTPQATASAADFGDVVSMSATLCRLCDRTVLYAHGDDAKAMRHHIETVHPDLTWKDITCP